MQIFVRHPSTGATLVFDCSKDTTLQDLIGWVEDKTGWPRNAYYIIRHGKLIPYKNQLEKTFSELDIQADNTLHLTGRFSSRSPS
jgi:hypothetical protein